MADDEFPPEDELQSRQGPLYPVGRALRQTFDAENHDSLGNDLTGLMLELARIDPAATPIARGVPPATPAPLFAAAPPDQPARRPWWRAAVTRLLGR